MPARSPTMARINIFLFSITISFVAARLPLHSSYGDKCIFYPSTGHRYHDKEGPIGSSHKAVFLCGAYPTDADFTPLPGMETADDCSLACTGDCEGSTWSEVAGTEVQCHAFRNFQGQVDETEALIMMIGPPSKASPENQYAWLCDGHDPTAGPISKFIPPNIEAQYYCDKSPSTTQNLDPIDPSVKSPKDCLLKCKADSGCQASVWSVAPAGCSILHGSEGALVPQPRTVFTKYIEHQLPGTGNGQGSNAGPPNPITPGSASGGSSTGGPPNPIGH